VGEAEVVELDWVGEREEGWGGDWLEKVVWYLLVGHDDSVHSNHKCRS
jgi:hypothetical protein